ncbi:MAG: hypothetical protein K8F91_21815, partial [Candidatus Obscuribacterales bacterium]|nr:hypothetical protein [Candidatus Obscuribacterales bacterium]
MLAHSDESFERYSKAAATETDQSDLISLSVTGDEELRKLVAANVNAPKLLLKLLSRDPSPLVRLAADTNPSACCLESDDGRL